MHSMRIIATSVLILVALRAEAENRPAQASFDSRIQPAILRSLEEACTKTKAAAIELDVEKLNVTYKSGRRIEEMRALLLRWVELALKRVDEAQQRPSIEGAVALQILLAELRICVRDMESILDLSSQVDNSELAAEAAMPFVRLSTTLDRVEADGLSERVYEILSAADEALSNRITN